MRNICHLTNVIFFTPLFITPWQEARMGFLFSKPEPQNRVSAHDRAVLDLKAQRDRLKQFTKKVRL
jgi:hypothetical protein